MKTYLSTYLIFVMLVPFEVRAIAGQAQKEMMCDEREHRGVGRVYTFHARDDETEIGRGTIQVLPSSNRKLCITAAHCVTSGFHTTGVTVGGIFIWVQRIFTHPDLDVAILELEESVPYLQESDLPILPPRKNKWRTARRTSEEDKKSQESSSILTAEVVGFGSSSSDGIHPGLLTSVSWKSKNKGNVNVTLRGSEYVSDWRLSQDERQVYAGPGDSGGPLLLGNTLMGLTTSHKECFSWIYAAFSPLTKRQHRRLVKADKKPLVKFSCNDVNVFVYDGENDENVKIYIDGDKYSFQDILTIITRESGLYKCSEIPPFQSIVDRVLHLSRDETRIVHTSYFVDIAQCMGWIEGIYTECGLSINLN